MEGWRFEIAEAQSLRAGLKKGILGGPYEPPRAAVGVAGSLDLRWSDGLMTLASLDRLAVGDFEDRLACWRAAAFRDPSAAPIAAPRACPEVRAHDPAVDALVGHDPMPLFRLLDRARRVLAGHRREQMEASAGATRGRRFIRGSTGLRVDFPETSFSVNLSSEELHWGYFGKRRWPTEEELEALFGRVAVTASQLRRDEDLPAPKPAVLLAPEVAAAFVARFLTLNLSGPSVINGHSAFTLDDFKCARTVIREDLTLSVDTTLPLELAASPCSSEGVPGGRADLIRSGRLVTPLLDLKYARLTGMPPTPVPRGHPTVVLEQANGLVSLEDALGALDAGLIVHFAMGLHAQAPARGRYSVLAPQAQVVRGGVPGGKVRVRLAGDFFAHMRDPGSVLVRFPYEIFPGLLLAPGAVSVEEGP